MPVDPSPEATPATALVVIEPSPDGLTDVVRTSLGVIVGTVYPPTDDEPRPTLELDLGWAKRAGVRVRLLGDVAVDRNRGGVVIDR